MKIAVDLSKEYGIVLEGGGAKGAYQIGAWRALEEAGVKIKGISGASVGALNGALMCMGELERAEELWKNIEYSQVMNVNDDMVKALKKKDFKSLNLYEVLASGLSVLREGGFDIAPLKRLIASTVDEEKIRASERELYVVTYSVSDWREMTVEVNRAEPGTVGDMLLASAYFLAFKNEKLNGKRYMDGGGFNNVPVNVLLDKGYRDIIIIRIYGWGFDSEKVVRIPEEANVYHIAPRQDLGGILEFDKKQCRRNMTLGYYDAKRFLYNLGGRRYYIDTPYSEAYYFDRMMSEQELVKLCAQMTLGTDHICGRNNYRAFTEELFPMLAKQLKLKEDWDYRELYTAVLEELAKSMRIRRFRVYTVEDLVSKIYGRLRSMALRDEGLWAAQSPLDSGIPL